MRFARLAILAAVLALPAAPQVDPWAAWADVWNPFANKMNRGVFDDKMWPKVRKQFHQLEKAVGDGYSSREDHPGIH